MDAASIAYDSDPELTDHPAELALSRHGGMEGFGRLVDGEIARLRDALSREESQSAAARADAAQARTEAKVAAKREYVTEYAYRAAVAELKKAGVAAEAITALTEKHRRDLINAQVEDDDFATIHVLRGEKTD